MNYVSTRNKTNKVTASQAILQGLAPDGGLYVPEVLPQMNLDLKDLAHLSYQDLAVEILSLFLGDFSKDQVLRSVQAAYDDSFSHPLIAPVQAVGDNYHLELFHGPTLAFKDMALSILPHLMKEAGRINDSDQEILILTATSGDTGKAAMEGFADVNGTRIIVFYPKGGVSSIQEQQMVTQEGDNTYVVSIEGNFDDAQTEVKRIFNNQNLREELAESNIQFSSANSMNIGRLVPQIVYYFYAYGQLLKDGIIRAGDPINFTVPTGNFGNILAGYYAKRMGLPIGKLVSASNDNKVLYDFFQSLTYDRNRPFELTISPSMDILVSSNFERLVYHALGEDSDQTARLMEDLDKDGTYVVPKRYQDGFSDFLGAFATEEETQDEIKEVYEASGYVMDPHTAVASRSLKKVQATGGFNTYPNVIVSTASPFKFPEAVLDALGVDTDGLSEEEILARLEKVAARPLPKAMDGLMEAPRRHHLSVKVSDMEETVLKIAHS